MDRRRRADELGAAGRLAGAIALIAGLLGGGPALAEPYLAVRAGLACSVCHVNPTGGGKRRTYGAVFGSGVLPEGRLDAASGAADDGVWTGDVGEHLGLGADARMNVDSTHVAGREDTFAFALRSAQLYVDLRLVPERLSLYVDEHVAPGTALNRETYALLWSKSRHAYVKAGRFFLPYGLRLEDDSAFIRQVTGINFTSSDQGVEGGLEYGPWSGALAVSNGTGGGAENDRGKQFSLLGSYVKPLWRLGASANVNRSDGGDRTMRGVFAGLRTGPVVWLAEADGIVDEDSVAGTHSQLAALLEADFELARGHNLKLTLERYDPDRAVADDERSRVSFVWEYFPFQYTQFRLGLRDNRGPLQIAALNADELFLQWHLFF